MTTTYIIDPASSLTNVLSETTGTATTRYLYGLDLLAQGDSAATRYFEYDGLGSVRQLTDSTGGVNLAQTFDPYGNPYASAGSATSNYGYTGEQIDSDKLVYLRARYYNPSMGQFMQADPSGFERNLYQYAGSNPVRYADPSGQCYSWLSPMRQLAPGWCQNIDTANGVVSAGVINSLNTGKLPSAETVRALGYIGASGVVVGSTLDLGIALNPGGALLGAGIGSTYGLYRVNATSAWGNPAEKAWAREHGDEFILGNTILGGSLGGYFGGLASLGPLGLLTASSIGLGWSAHAVVSTAMDIRDNGWSVTRGYDLAWGFGGLFASGYGFSRGYSGYAAINAYNQSLASRPSTLPIEDIYWAQRTLDYKFGENAGPFSNMPLEEAAQIIKNNPEQLNPIRVFEKQPWMDEFTPASRIRSNGTIDTGDWATMENGEIYTLNNRSYTVATMAGMKNVPVEWVPWEEIYAYSYQFDSPNFGTSIWIRPNGPQWNGGMNR